MIGCLGDVYFSVSSEAVQTINDLSMSKSASYATHKICGGKAILEFTGNDPDDISFSIELSAFLGVDPAVLIKRLDEMVDSGEAVSFVLGTTVYGTGLWVVTDISKAFDMIYKDGALISASVKLSLKEYGG